MTDARRDEEIRALHRARPRSRFLRASLAALGALIAWAWASGEFTPAALWSERSARNLARFFRDVRPWPLQGEAWDWGVAGAWVGEVLGEGRGREAILATLAFSVAAIVLAGLLAAAASVGGARNLAHPEPFLPSAHPPRAARRWAWRALHGAVRFLLVFLRAIPEYVWAFLLLNLLGVGAWPAVLALALHNAGILGKLFSETTENMEPHAPRALRGAGASRLRIVATAVFPLGLNRWLLYFFYRWETCVREASVLGLLGFVSLGWYIQQARAAIRYDEMLLFILLGSALILLGDLVSVVARGVLRRSA